MIIGASVGHYVGATIADGGYRRGPITYHDLQTLDWVFHAQPFCDVRFDGTTYGSLDTVFHAQPMLPLGPGDLDSIMYLDNLVFAGGL